MNLSSLDAKLERGVGILGKKYFTRHNNAFTLIELMIVIVIVGILSTVGLASYKQYRLKTKLAEAYVAIEKITKDETIHYNEYAEFEIVNRAMPTYTPSSIPGTIVADPDLNGWNSLGYPFPIGATSFFSYFIRAGCTDASGNEAVIAQHDGDSPTTSIISYANQIAPGTGTFCSNQWRPSTLGVSPTGKPNYYWAFITATSDIGENFGTCTRLHKIVDIDSQKKVNAGRSIVILNWGE